VLQTPCTAASPASALGLKGRRLPVNWSDIPSPLVWKALSPRIHTEPEASSLPVWIRLNPSLCRGLCVQVTQGDQPSPCGCDVLTAS
jgi:hypothetical protein